MKKAVVNDSMTQMKKLPGVLMRLVMLDSDLAELYGYEVKRLNEQVRRNKERFPDDFMFQLTKEDIEVVKSQFATSRERGFFSD